MGLGDCRLQIVIWILNDYEVPYDGLHRTHFVKSCDTMYESVYV